MARRACTLKERPMTELTTKIGRFDPATRRVAVSFTAGDIVHNRHVNAVTNASGKYDRKATAASARWETSPEATP